MTFGLIAVEPPTSAHPGLCPPPVSRYPVDAAGVAVEWIEAEPATPGQATLVCFAGPHRNGVGLAAIRPLATRLAIATEARVLSVGCRPLAGPCRASVESGVAAWVWLLGEGCDLSTTAFVSTPAGRARAVDVLRRAAERELSLPAVGAWCCTGEGPSMPAPGGIDLRLLLVQAGAVELSRPATEATTASLAYL